MTDWWLISGRDVQALRSWLVGLAQVNDPVVSKIVRHMLRILETGLHTTDAKPEDHAAQPAPDEPEFPF